MREPLVVEPFGNSARVAMLLLRVADATTGNRDGVVGNEALAPNAVMRRGTATELASSIVPAFARSATVRTGEARLCSFLAQAEQRWCEPVTRLARPPHVSPADWVTFRVGKAALLERFDLEPGDAVELLVRARGEVDSCTIAPRDLFVQRFRPLVAWNGACVVIAPGYAQSGRNYSEQALLAARRGYEVFVLDQQWVGLSQGAPGTIDRGFGVARDIAAVCATAHALRPGAKVIVAGTSIGAVGALLAVRFNELGRVKLENGAVMPSRVGAVLQSPYFGLHPRLKAVGWLARQVPFLGDLRVPRLRAGSVTNDAVASNKLLANAIIERTCSRARAFDAVDADCDRLASSLQAHPCAEDATPVHVIHARGDTLADHAATETWCKRIGPRAQLHSLDSTSHAMAESPTEQLYYLNALDAVLARL